MCTCSFKGFTSVPTTSEGALQKLRPPVRTVSESDVTGWIGFYNELWVIPWTHGVYIEVCVCANCIQIPSNPGSHRTFLDLTCSEWFHQRFTTLKGFRCEIMTSFSYFSLTEDWARLQHVLFRDDIMFLPLHWRSHGAEAGIKAEGARIFKTQEYRHKCPNSLPFLLLRIWSNWKSHSYTCTPTQATALSLLQNERKCQVVVFYIVCVHSRRWNTALTHLFLLIQINSSLCNNCGQVNASQKQTSALNKWTWSCGNVKTNVGMPIEPDWNKQQQQQKLLCYCKTQNEINTAERIRSVGCLWRNNRRLTVSGLDGVHGNLLSLPACDTKI